MNISEAMEYGARQGYLCFAIPGERDGEPAVLFAALPAARLGEHIRSDDWRIRTLAFAGAMTALHVHAEREGMVPQND